MFAVLLMTMAVLAALSAEAGFVQNGQALNDWKTTSKSIQSVCGKTLYGDMCISSLASHYQALSQNLGTADLAMLAVDVALEGAERTYSLALNLSRSPFISRSERAGIKDCVELLEGTRDHLNVALLHLSQNSSRQKRHIDNVHTWLSASLTDQDTCLQGFENIKESRVKNLVETNVQNVSQLISNSLAIFKVTTMEKVHVGGSKLPTFPSNHRRRRLLHHGMRIQRKSVKEDGFPSWVLAADRRILKAAPSAIKPNVVVAKDGSGNYETITEALNAAPRGSKARYVIYVKSGVYNEIVRVSEPNVVLVGDGKHRTFVVAARSVNGGWTTYNSATFAVRGEGFMARDMTFQNRAGPSKHQAVALRIGSDKSVVYRCNVVGYQDTLYAHSLRQFYRDCDIYGTVDFIFGNAAAVFQNCNLLARKPMAGQFITITAQGRKDPNQNTGFSIHRCRVMGASDLLPVKSSFPAYLGRPWKEYSRTVYMQSYLGDIIDPAGWREWSGNFALRTLFYAEYMNSGPGAGTAKRVKWPGFRVLTSAAEANKFTVAEFIAGNLWLPSTGVAFLPGLNK